MNQFLRLLCFCLKGSNEPRSPIQVSENPQAAKNADNSKVEDEKLPDDLGQTIDNEVKPSDLKDLSEEPKNQSPDAIEPPQRLEERKISFNQEVEEESSSEENQNSHGNTHHKKTKKRYLKTNYEMKKD